MSRNGYDYPIYLFNEGTNCECYKFFCPCYVQKDGRKYWRFRVWAPMAKSVALVGDFNCWDREKNRMEKIGASGVWETYARGLKKYANYKYSVEDRFGNVRNKSDPYATHAETMRGGASKLYDIGGFEWSDAEYLEKRRTRNTYKEPMNIYEAHLGSWRTHDDGSPYSYRDLAVELVEYAKDMGYTHIELLPVTEYPYEGSWGYQTTGLYAPTSRYGTPFDFMEFVDSCHRNGIGVIMDFVLSHFPKDEYGLFEFDGSCLYEYSDAYKQEHRAWGTRVYDFNKPQVRCFLISAVDFWIAKYHIDGMRLDAVASMLYLNYDRADGEWERNEQGGEYNLEAIYFLQALNNAILSRHPDVMMIAEESTAFPMVTMPPSYGGLGFNYKWNMGWMNDTLDYVKIDPFFRKGAHSKLTFSITYAFSENYILPFSHDEVVHGKASLIGKMPGEYENKFSGLKTLMSYQIAHPGKKLNFMGNEIAQFIEWDYRKQLDWLLLKYDAHYRYREFVRELNRLYLSEKALYELDTSYDGFKWTVVDDNTQNVLVFTRYASNGDSVIFAGNFSYERRPNYSIGVDKSGEYRVILNSEWKRFGGSAETERDIVSEDAPNHGKKQSITLDIPSGGALFVKLVREYQDADRVIVYGSGKKKARGARRKPGDAAERKKSRAGKTGEGKA